MITAGPTEDVSPHRRKLARSLSVGALVFTILWLLICALFAIQIIGGVVEGGELVMGGLVLTAPPVFICTVGAMLLVGRKRSKLAWVSALLWLSPVIVLLVFAGIAELLSSAKR